MSCLLSFTVHCMLIDRVAFVKLFIWHHSLVQNYIIPHCGSFWFTLVSVDAFYVKAPPGCVACFVTYSIRLVAARCGARINWLIIVTFIDLRRVALDKFHRRTISSR